VLCQHEQVREAVVVAQKTAAGGGQQRLVGYVVAEDGAELQTSELRQHLAEKLPEHMIPSVFVHLDKLPLTPNGKVDRRALPAPDASRPELLRQFVAARTAAEQIVAEVWVGVLGIERVGIYDNFFELGGHSLLATQVISQVKEIFDTDLPLRNLFENPTVDGLVSGIAESWGGYEAVEAIAQTYIELENLSEDEVKNRLLDEHEAAEQPVLD
jgi:acyl carrier protein